MQLGWRVVYSLFSLVFTWFCSLVQGREQTSVFCWGTRGFGSPITFMADLLCYCSACLEEKLLPRLCVPVGCQQFSPVMGWWQPGLPQLFSSDSTVFLIFFLIGGAVEDSGEAGVLLWVSGGVQCLHHSPGVSGPSPSLRWCWGRTTPPCLWDPTPGSGCLCVGFHLSPTINIHKEFCFSTETLGKLFASVSLHIFSESVLISNGWV